MRPHPSSPGIPVQELSNSPPPPNFDATAQSPPVSGIPSRNNSSTNAPAHPTGSHGNTSKKSQSPWFTPAFSSGITHAKVGRTSRHDGGRSNSVTGARSLHDPIVIGPGIYIDPVSIKRPAELLSNSPEKAENSHYDSPGKRIRLSRQKPPVTLLPAKKRDRTGALVVIPKWVQAVIENFSPSRIEENCIPDIDSVLTNSFGDENFPPHSRIPVSDDDRKPALEFLKLAIHLHLRVITADSLDESTWYSIICCLLSIEPPKPKSLIPTIPNPNMPDSYAFLQTVNATKLTTKLTTAVVPPPININLDALLVVNTSDDKTVARAVMRNVCLNAFLEPSLKDRIVALGVQAKSSGSAMQAQYQIAVWGMETINITAKIARMYEKNTGVGWEQSRACNVAVGLTVWGHVWSYSLTYRAANGALATHGPIVVGSTDSLYGTCKVLRWVTVFKTWVAVEVWPAWKLLLEGAVGVEEDREGV